MITTSDGEIYEDETAHALGVQKQTKVASNSNEDIFLPSTAYPKDTRPLVKEYKGTPAEIYNLYRGSGASHDDAVQFTRDHIIKSQDDIAGKTFRGDYPKFDNDEDLEEFLKTFKGSQNEQKPVTLAMNLENIQPSKHTQVRGVIADALAKFSLTLPRVYQKNTDPINVGEGVIHKENSISQSLSQSIGHAGDRAYGRSEKKEFDALDYQKRLDDWVANGKDNDPLPDPF